MFSIYAVYYCQKDNMMSITWVWHKMGGASCMMDKKEPFNPYDFDIFKISV